MEMTGRDGVLYVPSKSSYIRGEQGKSFAFTDAARLGMLQAVADHNPWMRVIDREVFSEVQPRTYDTLCSIRDSGYQPALLMGSDKLPELEHIWKHVEEITEQFGIVCMCRGMDDVQKMISEDPYLKSISAGITMLQTPPALRKISSTAVRSILQQIRNVREQSGPERSLENLIISLKELVPEEVAQFILGEELTAGQNGGIE